jgi:hypothetical protein
VRKLFVLLAVAAALPLHAQWLNHPDRRIPRTADGRPKLDAPAPRLNGVPDLSGIWQSERTPTSEFERVMGKGFADVQIDLYDINKYMLNVFWGLPPDQQPLKPNARDVMKERQGQPKTNLCLPAGLPQSLFVLMSKMVQTPEEIVMLWGNGDPTRQIHMDGRGLEKDPNPAWTGYSVGRWEADTLVVETNGMNTRADLDAVGHPRSESMRITERYRRRDFGHMDLEITVNDPVYYTRPFSIKTELTLIPDTDMLEYVCNENERDLPHIK